jgi:hypothetical protein
LVNEKTFKGFLRGNGILVDAAFSGDQCMLGINASIMPNNFFFLNGEIITQLGYELLFPSTETKARVISIAQTDLSKVFVVEFGPLGPISVNSVS